MIKNWKKILGIYLLVLLLVNIVWFFTYKHLVAQDYIKTTGTVISISDESASGSYGSQDTKYPTYQYTDTQGRSHIYQSTDGFNQFTKIIFGSKIGDNFTLYYNRNKPDKDVLVAHGGDYWTVLAAPFVAGVFLPASIGFLIYMASKRVRRT